MRMPVEPSIAFPEMPLAAEPSGSAHSVRNVRKTCCDSHLHLPSSPASLTRSDILLGKSQPQVTAAIFHLLSERHRFTP